MDLNMELVGLEVFLSKSSVPPGSTKPFAEGLFTANVTNATDKSIASIATGTVNQTIDGYTLQCVGGGIIVVGDAEISIPGKFVHETSTL